VGILIYLNLCFLSCVIEMQDGSKISKINKSKEGKMLVKCVVSTKTQKPNKEVRITKTQKPNKEVRIGILGASGYTGSEV
jgi:hypothetical protein